jgi:hypothetical protein
MTDSLKGFKVGDHVKQQVRQPQKPAPTAVEPSPSVGFPRIEALVESAVPDLSGLESRLAALRGIESQAKGQKDKSAAKRAVIGYERVLDLVRYLLETKANMQASAVQQVP